MARKLIDYESMTAYHRKATEHFAAADHEHERPDWGVSDEASPSYIRNRTHYEDVELDPKGGLTATGLSEWGENTWGETVYTATGNDGWCPEWDEGWLVEWGGAEYVCEYSEYDWKWRIGNQWLTDGDKDDTGEPFLIEFSSETEDGAWTLYTTESEMPEVSVSTRYSHIAELDRKYLPQDVREGADWDEEDAESARYIHNKPFGDEYYQNEVFYAEGVAMEAAGAQNDDGEDLYVGRGTYEYPFEFVEGGSYILTSSDYDYHDVTAHVQDGRVVIGNARYVDEGASSPWHTFYFEMDPETGGWEFWSPNATAREWVRIEEYGYHANPIDARFMPAEVARAEDVYTRHEVDEKLVAPDWSAPEGEPGHVLGRTHYEDVTETYLCTLSLSLADEDGSGVFACEGTNADFVVEPGQSIVVEWPGYWANCVQESHEGRYAYGNMAFVGGYDSDTPYLILTDGAGSYTFYAGAGDVPEVGIRAEHVDLQVLDEKFLPEAVSRVGHAHGLDEVEGLREALDAKAAADHTHDLATSEAAGLMSAEDKAKLDGLGSADGDTLTDEEFLSEVMADE